MRGIVIVIFVVLTGAAGCHHPPRAKSTGPKIEEYPLPPAAPAAGQPRPTTS